MGPADKSSGRLRAPQGSSGHSGWEMLDPTIQSGETLLALQAFNSDLRRPCFWSEAHAVEKGMFFRTKDKMTKRQTEINPSGRIKRTH